jgi:hypothetical protein
LITFGSGCEGGDKTSLEIPRNEQLLNDIINNADLFLSLEGLNCYTVALLNCSFKNKILLP